MRDVGILASAPMMSISFASSRPRSWTCAIVAASSSSASTARSPSPACVWAADRSGAPIRSSSASSGQSSPVMIFPRIAMRDKASAHIDYLHTRCSLLLADLASLELAQHCKKFAMRMRRGRAVAVSRLDRKVPQRNDREAFVVQQLNVVAPLGIRGGAGNRNRVCETLGRHFLQQRNFLDGKWQQSLVRRDIFPILKRGGQLECAVD